MWDDKVHGSGMDVFPGPARLKQFSREIVYGRPVTNDQIAEALGATAVRPFRIAERTLTGVTRRAAGEPAVAHSADVALRAVDLGYPPDVIARCLLHDVLEDECSKLTELAAATRRLEADVGCQIAGDVLRLSNRYGIILSEIARHLHEPPSHSVESLRAVAVALTDYEQTLPANVRKEFGHELEQVRWWLGTVDVARLPSASHVDGARGLLTALRRQIYGLYVQELADETRSRLQRPAARLPEGLLAAKVFDLMDNLRTTELACEPLLRTLWKAEQVLDRSFFLHELAVRALPSCTIVPLYGCLKATLVEQLVQRRHALDSLADSRFEPLALLLGDEICRLEGKYEVAAPLQALIELREEIRRRNGAPAGDEADGPGDAAAQQEMQR